MATLLQFRTLSRAVQVDPESVETYTGPLSTTAANVEASAEAATDFQFAGDVGPVTAFNVEPTGMSVTVGMVALGASFTGATARVTTDASDDKSPSDTLTVKVAFPFSWVSGW